jgi:hypothetical protein
LKEPHKESKEKSAKLGLLRTRRVGINEEKVKEKEY